jgi:GT2 family glycosyltransferase
MAPAVSVLTAVHDPDPEHLAACIASVAAQTLTDWEHIVVDDGSTRAGIADVLARAAADPRVRIIRRDARGGIVAASRDALAAANGELVALLDHDDVLEPTALAEMVAALGDDGVLAYSDHDLLLADGSAGPAYFKPDFSPEQLRNQNYVLHLIVARRSVVDAVGGFRDGFDGAQDHDLLLRVSEHDSRIVHVQRVLYHWRQAPASVAADPSAKPWAYDAGRRAVQDHCDRTGIAAVVEPGPIAGTYHVVRELADPPTISVIIPTRGSSRRIWGVMRCFVVEAVRSLMFASTYPDLEIVVVYDTGTPAPVLQTLRDLVGERLVLVEYTKPFNFSDKINVGVAASTGELSLLLNDDTELIEPRSLEVMAAHLLDDRVGMVGAKLLFADGTIQDGGHVYNEHVLGGLVGWPGDSLGPGQLRPLGVEREVAGVTAAAALVRRSVLDAVGGFDPELYMNFNDVDVCLKIRATGRRIVWTPYASWHHFESQTRAPSAEPEEWTEIDRRWHDEINADPYYNRNHLPRRSDWLERPWHSGTPPLLADDAAQSHRSWLHERLLDTLDGGRRAALAIWRAPLLGLVVLLAAWLLATEVDAGPGIARRLAATLLPVVIWTIMTALALHRERWVLAAAFVVAVTPAALGQLALAGWSAIAWTVALVGGAAVGPAWRARRPVGAAAVVAVIAVLSANWWREAGRTAHSDTGPLDVVVDAFSPFGLHDGLAATLAVVVWALAALAVVAMSIRSRGWEAAAWVAPAVVVPALLASWVADEQGSAAPTAAGLFGVGALVVAGARVDHATPGGRPLVTGVAAGAAVVWAATLLEHRDGFGWEVAVAVGLAAVTAAVATVIATQRRQRRFADV